MQCDAVRLIGSRKERATTSFYYMLTSICTRYVLPAKLAKIHHSDIDALARESRFDIPYDKYLSVSIFTVYCSVCQCFGGLVWAQF